MSFRFKEPGRMEPGQGPDDMRPSMGGNINDPKLGDNRMFGNMDNDKSLRDDMDSRFSKFDAGRGRRPMPFGRGRRPSPTRDKPFGDRPRDFGFGRDEMAPGRDRSPLRGGFDDRFPDRFKKDDTAYPRREELGRKDPSRPFVDEPFRDKYMGMDTRSRFDTQGNFNSRFEPPDEQFKHRPFNYPTAPYKGYFKNDAAPKPNECEIIVVKKEQRSYAETVEQRMKNLGIQVDILFLKDEALLVQTIDDIARRGSLYAMVISPLNETHGSVTLNILYGTPQEHRNMPLDDALKLVARNFHDHIRNQREVMDREKTDRGVYSGSCPPDREVQFLLRILADGRAISVAELENVIRYLTERRDKMKSPQGDRGSGAVGPTVPADVKNVVPTKPKDDVDIAQKEQDLQNRIMNIINQGGPPDSSGNPAATGNVGGMNQPPMGSNVSGMGADMPGSRQNQPVMEPKQPHMGTNQPGLGPNIGSVGPNQPAMGPNRPGMGPNQPGMGPNRSGMGANQPGMGPNRPGVGPNQSGMGPNQHGIGPNQQGMGSMQSNIGKNQPGMGPNQPAMGSNLPGMGSNLPGMGSNLPGMGTNQPPPSAASTYINFDNPSVQKALDNLMQSGPNLLKNISLTGSNPPNSQGMQDTSPMKMPPGNVGGGMGAQRGSGGMGDVGGMGPQRGNMGPPQGQGMGPPQSQGMGPPQGMGGPQGQSMGLPHGQGMGPPQGQGMGPHSQGMGHGPMSGMGPGHGPPYPGQGQQGMYNSGPNMMGNMSRQPYMGGHMGNQGGGMGGGPRRY